MPVKKPIPPLPRDRVVIDFEAFLEASKAESKKGVDAEVVVPNFEFDDDGDVILSADQTDCLTLRLVPKMGASALSVLSQNRGRMSTLNMLPLFESLIHPKDLHLWRARIDDPTTPVHEVWILKAASGLMSKYGVDTEDEPGKAGS